MFTKTKLFAVQFGISCCLFFIAVPAAFAQESACEGEVGAAFGLCNAYCEAMDCDEDAQASEGACTKVSANFEKITGRQPPCENECPCTAFANLDQFGEKQGCTASPTVGILFDGGLVCVGGNCSTDFTQSGCVALSFDESGLFQSEPFDINSDEEQACVAVVEALCN